MDLVGKYGVPEPNKSPNKHIIRLYKQHPELFNIEFHELRKLKRIGAGSFGTVYKSVYNGEPVAVKRIETNADSATYKYLLREVLNLKKANHNNILKFIGLTHEEKREVYMVTDLVEGGSLDKMAKKIKKNYPVLIEIFCKVAFAMRYLNSQNMIHRDLKPGNILVSNDFQIVKLCDFGLSVNPDDDVGKSSRDRSARKMTCVGSGNYMAPEVKVGKGTFESDVYSFGVTFAILLGYPSKLQKKVFDAEAFARKRDKNAPEELVTFVKNCTNSDFRKRPTFSAIVSELIRIHNDLYRDSPPLVDEIESIAMDVEVPSLRRMSSKANVRRRSRVRSMEFKGGPPVSSNRLRSQVTLEAPDLAAIRNQQLSATC